MPNYARNQCQQANQTVASDVHSGKIKSASGETFNISCPSGSAARARSSFLAKRRKRYRSIDSLFDNTGQRLRPRLRQDRGKETGRTLVVVISNRRDEGNPNGMLEPRPASRKPA
jgi:hypothetical protein